MKEITMKAASEMDRLDLVEDRTEERGGEKGRMVFGFLSGAVFV